MADTPPVASGSIGVDIEGDAESVEHILRKLELEILSETGLALFLSTVVGEYLQQRAMQRFQNQGDDVSGAWAPLKPTTISIREEMGFGAGPINSRTGELEAFITGSNGSVSVSGGGGSVLTFPGNPPGPGQSGYLETKVMTAQKGRGYPETVARPVLGMNEVDLSFVITSLAFYVGEAGKL